MKIKKFHIFFCLLFVLLLSCKTSPVVKTIEWNTEEDKPSEENLQKSDELHNQIAEVYRSIISHNNIQFALQGESYGVRVILNISNLPEQDITSTVIMNMQIFTGRVMTLNSLTDEFEISVNDVIIPARLIVFNKENQRPQNIPRNSIFELSIELTPDSTIDLLMAINATKDLILNSTRDLKRHHIAWVRSEILNLYRCQFKISSPSLTIPLNRVIFTVE